MADTNNSSDAVGVDILLGSGKRSSRSRVQIYQTWNHMMGDPIVSTGLRLHVTLALGGQETTGDSVFIERKPGIADSDPRATIVEELQRDLTGLLNKHAYTLCFNASGFGDAYGRVYTKADIGVVDLDTGEAVYPPLVQPYERGSRTVSYALSNAESGTSHLTAKQMARMKMPRLEYIPQAQALERVTQQNILEDNIDNLLPLPSLVGGSLLFAAEEAFSNLTAAIAGLVGQRILSSIDETLVSVDMDGMSLEQRKDFMASLSSMFRTMKERAEHLISDGNYSAQRNIHLMPSSGSKQLTQVSSLQSASAGALLGIDDVLFHARLLAGAFGIDLSMLGFANQLGGGLGEGGFSQTSAQVSERSRAIRNAFTDFCHSIIDLHTDARYGWVYEDDQRPYTINFHSALSALAASRQSARERGVNTTVMLVQVLQSLRDIGLDEAAIKVLLAKGVQLDADDAALLAKSLKTANAAGSTVTGGA